MARVYTKVSIPAEVVSRTQQSAREEGMEESVSGYLGNLVRAMLLLRERDYQQYAKLMRTGNVTGWEGVEQLWKNKDARRAEYEISKEEATDEEVD